MSGAGLPATEPHAMLSDSEFEDADADLEAQFRVLDAQSPHVHGSMANSRRNLSLSLNDASNLSQFSGFSISDFSSHSLDVAAAGAIEASSIREDEDAGSSASLEADRQMETFSHEMESFWLNDPRFNRGMGGPESQFVSCHILSHAFRGHGPHFLVRCLGFEFPIWVPEEALSEIEPFRVHRAIVQRIARVNLPVNRESIPSVLAALSQSEVGSAAPLASPLPPPPASAFSSRRTQPAGVRFSDARGRHWRGRGAGTGRGRSFERLADPLAGNTPPSPPPTAGRTAASGLDDSASTLNRIKEPNCMVVRGSQWVAGETVGPPRWVQGTQMQAVRFQVYGPTSQFPLDDLRMLGAPLSQRPSTPVSHRIDSDSGTLGLHAGEEVVHAHDPGEDFVVAADSTFADFARTLTSHSKFKAYEADLHRTMFSHPNGTAVKVRHANGDYESGHLTFIQTSSRAAPMVSVYFPASPERGVVDFASWDVWRSGFNRGFSGFQAKHSDSLYYEMHDHLQAFSSGTRFSQSTPHVLPQSLGSALSERAGVSSSAAGRLDSSRAPHRGDSDDDSRQDGSYSNASYNPSATSTRKSRKDSPPLQRPFNTSKINKYIGQNELGPVEQYELRPGSWAAEAYAILRQNGIANEHTVTNALSCVSYTIRNEYIRTHMTPDDGQGEWHLYDSEDRPPRLESTVFSYFAKWLQKRFTSSTLTVGQLQQQLRNLRQGSRLIFEHNAEFNRLLDLIHELRLVHDTDYSQLFQGETNPMRREFREDRLQYLRSIREDIAGMLYRWVVTKNIERTFDQLPAADTAGMERDVLASRFKLDGGCEPRLLQLQQAAVALESELKDAPQHFARSDAPAARFTTATRATDPFRSRRGPSPASRSLRLPAPPRIHHLDADDGEVEETELELLYQKLANEGRVSWTRAQIKKLFDENRCFKCTEQGHKAPECKNAAVNPRTHRFSHNLVEIVSFNDDEELLFNALLEVEAGNGSASR